MKSYTIIAFILTSLGIVTFAIQGISYTTTEKCRALPLPPIVGVTCLVGGVALLVPGRKRS